MTIQIILKRDLYPPIDQITGQGQNRSLSHRHGADAPAAATPSLPARHDGGAMLTAAPMHEGLEVRASLCDSTPGVENVTASNRAAALLRIARRPLGLDRGEAGAR